MKAGNVGTALVCAVLSAPLQAGTDCAPIVELATGAAPSAQNSNRWQAAFEMRSSQNTHATMLCTAPDGADGDVACLWEFELGDPDARLFASQLDMFLSSCLTGQADIFEDASVNHPDFYAARTYDLGRRTLRTALKDKAALGLSRVTFRVYDRANTGE